MTEQQALALCRQAVALVKQLDAKAEAQASLWGGHRAHTRFARNEITTSGEIDDAALSLTVRLGLRLASATSNQTDAASLKALAERTLAIARLAPEQPESMPLVGAAKVEKVVLRDDAMSRLDAAARAKGIAEALAPSREADLLTAGFLQVTDGFFALANSAGLGSSQSFTDSEFSVTARTKDGTGSGWSSVCTRRRAELDFAQIGKVAAQKAISTAKPRSLDPGRYTVVLEPAASTELFQYFSMALDRRGVDENRSALTGKLGQQVMSPKLSLKSDPKTSSIMPFDDEGTPLAPRTWVKAGVLEQLGVSRFWGKKQNVPATGRYDGFEVAPGEETRLELLAGIQRGVLITRLWYTSLIDARTLAITGLTRDGTFLIENGAIAGPIRNFRINQSVLDALAKVDAVSSDRESPQASGWKVPAIRTHEFLLASQSEAI